VTHERHADFAGTNADDVKILDGKADILWRNYTSGRNVVWRLNGLSYAGDIELPKLEDFAWNVRGTGDFNQDGYADIVWRHNDGRNSVWLMHGNAIISTANLPALYDATWTLADVGDLDGNGTADLLWRRNNGQTSIWFFDRTNLIATASTGTVSTTWVVKAIADFDENGTGDILWRNMGSGEHSIWLMQGATISQAVSIPAVPDLTWDIEGAADFTGDGKTDILWRQPSSGRVHVWPMDGVSRLGTGQDINRLNSDTTWQIVGP